MNGMKKREQQMSEHEFYLKVTVRTDEDNPEPQPEDFAQFLNERFTVTPDQTYGTDAYNKDAPQLVTGVSVMPEHYLAQLWDQGAAAGERNAALREGSDGDPDEHFIINPFRSDDT